MLPGTANLKEQQNADFRQVITKQTAAGVAIDITGSTFEMQLRDPATPTVTTATWSSGNGKITLSDAAAGEITFAVTAADLLAITANTYDYDLIETTSGSVEFAWMKGSFTIEAAITQ